MQREILFRGKRIDNGEWVQGSLLAYADGDTFICCEDYIPDVLNKYEVDPATVGQDTGLADKNGVRIFEGDIIHGKVIGDIWAGEIVWIDRIAGFGVRYAHRTDPTAWENSSILKQLLRYREDEFSAEVIGNIHDNLELLEAGK